LERKIEVSKKIFCFEVLDGGAKKPVIVYTYTVKYLNTCASALIEYTSGLLFAQGFI